MNLYYVEIEDGASHREYVAFAKAMSRLDAKHPDFSGSMNRRLVKHHMDEATVKLMITEEMNDEDDVRVSKVTDKDLNERLSGYRDLIRNYYMPHDDFPDISL